MVSMNVEVMCYRNRMEEPPWFETSALVLHMVAAAVLAAATIMLAMPASAFGAQNVVIRHTGFDKVGAQSYGLSLGDIDLGSAKITTGSNFKASNNVVTFKDQNPTASTTVTRKKAVTVNKKVSSNKETKISGTVVMLWDNVVTDAYGHEYDLKLKVSNVVVYPHGNYLGTIPANGIQVLSSNEKGNNTYASARFCGSAMKKKMAAAVKKGNNGGVWPSTGIALVGVRMDLEASIINSKGKAVSWGTFAYGCKDLDGNVLGKKPSHSNLPKYAESITFRSGLTEKDSDGTYIIHSGVDHVSNDGDSGTRFTLRLLKTTDGTRVYGWQQDSKGNNSHASDDASMEAVGFSAEVKASGFQFAWAGDHCDTKLFDESKATKADPTPVTAQLQKALDGTTTMKANRFSFTATNTSPAKGESGHIANQTVGNDKNGKVTFSYIIKKLGTWVFSVKENDTDEIKNGGILKDKGTRIFTIVLKSDDNGKAKSTVTYGKAGKTFNNTTVKPGVVQIPVEKILSVDSQMDGAALPNIKEAFTFTLEPQDKNAPMPANGGETVRNPDPNGGTVTFGEISVSTAGTWHYLVKEKGSVTDVDNDPSAANGKPVTVTSKQSGSAYNVTAEYGNDDDNEPLSAVTFKNTYHPSPLHVPLLVDKRLSNSTGLPSPDITECYQFQLTGAAAADIDRVRQKRVQTALEASYENTGDIYVDLSAWDDGVISVNDAAGSWADDWHMTCQNGQIVLSGTRNGQQTTIDTGLSDLDDLQAQGGGSEIKPQQAASNLAETRLAGECRTGQTTVTNPNASGGSASFGGVDLPAPGRYAFVVTEGHAKQPPFGMSDDADAEGKLIVAKVAYGSDGKLALEWLRTVVVADAYQSGATTKGIVFENAYQPPAAQIQVEKELDANEYGESSLPDITQAFEFQLHAVDDAPMPDKEGQAVKNPDVDGGLASFGTITYTQPGTYHYTVTESGIVTGITNDAEAQTGKKVSVVVSQKGTVTVSDDGGPTFTNTYEPVNMPFTGANGVPRLLIVGGIALAGLSTAFVFRTRSGKRSR